MKLRYCIVLIILTFIWGFFAGHLVCDAEAEQEMGAPRKGMWKLYLWPVLILWTVLAVIPYEWAAQKIAGLRSRSTDGGRG